MILESKNVKTECLDGFYLADNIIQKLGELSGESLVVVTDFDRCVSDNDTWGAIYETLDEQAKVEDQLSYRRYLDHGDNQLWWMETIQNYKSAGVTKDKIKEKIGTIVPRPGFLEFCQLIETHGIPLAIVSGGLEDAISMFAQRHNIYPELVLANRLEFNSDGELRGYSSKQIIHDANKSSIALNNQKLIEMQTNKTALVVGDGRSDPKVVNGGIAFRVGIDEDLSSNQREKFVNDSFKLGYDAVSTDGSWRPILKLAELILNN